MVSAKILAKEFRAVLLGKQKSDKNKESNIIALSSACAICLFSMLFIGIFPQYFVPTTFIINMLFILNAIVVSYFLKSESERINEDLALMDLTMKAIQLVRETERQVFAGFSMTDLKENNLSGVMNADKTLDKP